MHRVLWSVPLLVLITVTGQWETCEVVSSGIAVLDGDGLAVEH